MNTSIITFSPSAATIQNFSIIAIIILLAGILAPTIVKWIIRKQKGWRFKLIKDNGRLDLIDEFNYWYKRLVSERKSLEDASRQSETNEIGRDVEAVIAGRLDTLNKFLASRISGDKKLDAEAADELSSLIDNRQAFMDSTRKAFEASRPDLMHYLYAHGLTEQEANYCCLYMIGLRAKEIGNYLGLRSHYNISSRIRGKLGLESNSTNLGIYLRKLMQDKELHSREQAKPENKYTPWQLHGALLTETFFDYLGLMIIARAFIGENLALEIGICAATLVLVGAAIFTVVRHRADVVPIARLIASMSAFCYLELIGSVTLLLLFAEALIPAVAAPYIGYTAFVGSQLLMLYTAYRYTR